MKPSNNIYNTKPVPEKRDYHVAPFYKNLLKQGTTEEEANKIYEDVLYLVEEQQNCYLDTPIYRKFLEDGMTRKEAVETYKDIIKLVEKQRKESETNNNTSTKCVKQPSGTKLKATSRFQTQ